MQAYGRRGVHGRTVEALAHRVLSGQIPEGTTLDIVALRNELGVSLTALRESLKVLAAKGMVDARQRRGTYVRPRGDWNLLDTDVLRWRFGDSGVAAPDHQALLRSLGELHRIVEPGAARLAAIRRTDTDLAAMQSALARVQNVDVLEQAAEAAHAYQGFRRALLTAARNEILERVGAVVTLGMSFGDQLSQRVLARNDAFLPHLYGVFEAVRERNPDLAERTMRAFLGEVAEAD
ncbi:FadR family transcriptional regulator [Streptomyces sp. CAI-85]|nr:FadR family transcriptional regulator [Streptomyces sp. CAI-85]